MKIALVAATTKEIAPAVDYLSERLYLKSHHRFTTLVTGVGILSTAHALSSFLARERPDLALQAGIAGSFHPLFQPGTVVVVKEEIIGDMGVWEEDRWKDIYDLRLEDPDKYPFTGRKLVNSFHSLIEKSQLPAVCGITVNEITTDHSRNRVISYPYHPVSESMEGAAFHYVCLQEGIPFLQIRAISNWVGDRDKSNWKLAESIEALNMSLIALINKLTEQHLV
jgi:futalosine hydrolase